MHAEDGSARSISVMLVSLATAAITTMTLTGVGRKQRAALAVDDLLDNWYILGNRRGSQAQAGHQGIYGGNASHQPETGVKVWNRERNMDENT